MNRAVARFKGGQGKAFVCFECFGYEKVKLYIIALIILASDVPRFLVIHTAKRHSREGGSLYFQT